MKISPVFVVVCLAAFCSTVSAGCVSMEVVPLGTDSAKKGDGQVCGSSYLVTQRKGGKSVSQLGIAKTWYKTNFSGAHFRPVAFPVGYKANCPQHAPTKFITSWSGISDIYVRREFAVAPEALSTIRTMIIKYIMDDKILEVFLNNKKVTISDRPKTSGCGYWAGTNRIVVPASFLRAGKNVLAIRGVNTGGPCYMDFGIFFNACKDGVSRSDLHSCSAVDGPGLANRGCRARCEEENFCRNKDPEDCDTPFHADVTGDCLCEASEAMSCSGAPADVAPGVCYKSIWKTGQVSRVAFCPPKTDNTCKA